MRDGARGSRAAKTNLTSCTAPQFAASRRRHRFLGLDVTAAQSNTYLGLVRRHPKLFWPRLFLMLGNDDTWFYDYGTA